MGGKIIDVCVNVGLDALFPLFLRIRKTNPKSVLRDCLLCSSSLG